MPSQIPSELGLLLSSSPLWTSAGNVFLASACFELTAAQSTYVCQREFMPAWDAVGAAWTKVASSERDTHFFATIDFENAQTVFQKVGRVTNPANHTTHFSHLSSVYNLHPS